LLFLNHCYKIKAGDVEVQDAKFTTRPPWDYVAQFPVVTL